MNRREHWEWVYRSKLPTAVSWYQPEAELSMRLIRNVVPERDAAIIDIGGGASVLVDQLIAAGYSNLTVIDLSRAAVELVRARLGAHGVDVRWLEADILEATLPAGGYQFWHDRAVFHFLTEAGDRATYVAQAQRAIAPGGHILIATFAEDGPTRCSGLDVVRYTPDALHAELGAGFAMVAAHREEHHTPSGAVQAFTYCLCTRLP